MVNAVGSSGFQPRDKSLRNLTFSCSLRAGSSGGWDSCQISGLHRPADRSLRLSWEDTPPCLCPLSGHKLTRLRTSLNRRLHRPWGACYIPIWALDWLPSIDRSRTITGILGSSLLSC